CSAKLVLPKIVGDHDDRIHAPYLALLGRESTTHLWGNFEGLEKICAHLITQLEFARGILVCGEGSSDRVKRDQTRERLVVAAKVLEVGIGGPRLAISAQRQRTHRRRDCAQCHDL